MFSFRRLAAPQQARSAARYPPRRAATPGDLVPIVLLSLFCGCGGLDLGFELAGFPIGLAYDLRRDSIASWNRNRPGLARGHVADLRAIRFADIDGHFHARFAPSALIGGPPCQSFSRANRSPLPRDPRTKLVRRFFTLGLQFHRHRRPLDFMLLENVTGLQTVPHRAILDRELARLEANGFDVFHFLADAVRHSVPQRRERLFVLAFSRDTLAAQCWREPVGTDRCRTVSEVIRGLPPPAYFTRSLEPRAIPLHPNHWCMSPKSPRFFDGSLKEGYSSARSFKTLAWDEPSITASYGHREVHVHPDGRRRLSVFEAMQLQGFPTDYVLEGTLSGQIDQVSEAVPPPLAQAIAMSIRSALMGTPVQNSEPDYAPSASSLASASAP